MDGLDIKNQIQKLVESENDLSILQSIYVLLEKAHVDAVWKEKLTSRALKAEEDIKAGRIYTSEEFFDLMKDSLHGQ